MSGFNVDTFMHKENQGIFNNLIFTDTPGFYINEDIALQQIQQQAQAHRNKCEWIEDFLEDIENTVMNINENKNYYLFFWDVEKREYIWIGVVTFEKTMTHSGYDFYYISTRCAFKTSYILESSSYTSGRLLWIYILYQINILNESKPFIIYNNSIPSSYEYHLKMGMKPLNQTFEHIDDRQSIAYKLFTLHYSTVPIALEYIYDGHTEHVKYGNLFFCSDDKHINYLSPADIYYTMHNDFYRVLYTAGKKNRKYKLKSRRKRKISRKKRSKKRKYTRTRK